MNLKSSCSAQPSGGDLATDLCLPLEAVRGLVEASCNLSAAYVVTSWKDRQRSFTERAISARRPARPLVTLAIALAAAELSTRPGA